MTILEFVRDEAPKRCGVHSAAGKIAELVYYEELRDTGIFDKDQFANTRERAKMLLPFKPVDGLQYEACLDIVEVAMLKHAEVYHNEDTVERQVELVDAMSMEDQAVSAGVDGVWT